MISLSELPYEQFEMLGVKKSDILNLPPRTLNALLNGQRTSLIRFNNIHIAGLAGSNSIDAKLSIEVKPDGKPNLKIHPINKTATNTFNLKAEEIALLEKDNANVIEKSIKHADGSLRTVMIYLDKMTNEFIAINKASIRPPEEINSTPLTNQQKEDFRDGKPITVNGESFRINPNSEIGVSSIDGNDLKISKIRFKQSSYSNKELAFDLVLLGSESGNVVLLEHLANIALYTAPDSLNDHNALINISNPRYWEAINTACKEIKTLKEDKKYDTSIIAEIVNKHLFEMGIIHGDKRNDSKTLTADNTRRNEKSKSEKFFV